MLKPFLLIVVTLAGINAHGYQLYPPARSGTEDAPGAIGASPCGATAFETPGTPVMCFDKDLEYPLSWEITQDHGGTIAYNLLRVRDGEHEVIREIVDNVDNGGAGTTSYTHRFGSNCNDDCVLQWIWTPENENDQYFGCSDIRVGGNAQEGRADIINYNEANFIQQVSTFLNIDESRVRVITATGGSGSETRVDFVIENAPNCEGAKAAMNQLKGAQTGDFDDLQVSGRVSAVGGGGGGGDNDGPLVNINALYGLVAVVAVVIVVAVPLVIIGVAVMALLFEMPKAVDYGVHFTKETVENLQES